MGNAPFATGPREALNAALMQGTGDVHREAERRPFMVSLFKGELPKDAYVGYIARLWFVYDALETSIEGLRDDPRVGRMYLPEMFRRDKIGEDLAFFLGADWRAQISESAATKAYTEHIRGVAATFPVGYVAHQWIRYLGYVLGQGILRKLVTGAYGVGEEAMNFYSFPSIEVPKEFLGKYHGLMNSIELTDDEVAKVVAEGNASFQMQIDLTDELAEEFGIGVATKEETEALLEKLNAEHP